MADRIVHFGTDFVHRLLVLTSTGYEVDACGTSLEALENALRQDHVHAVAVTEDHTRLGEDAAALARSLTSAPVVLFEGVDRRCDRAKFDHVIPTGTPAPDWLRQFAETIERSRLIRQQSQTLRAESASLRQKSEATREVSRFQRQRAAQLATADELSKSAD